MCSLDPSKAAETRALARRILDNIGGVENLASGEVQFTRVKLTLLDPLKLNETSLLEGEEGFLIGILNRVEIENAIYLVIGRTKLANDLWNELSHVKEELPNF